MTVQRGTTPNPAYWAPYLGVSLFLRVYSAIRSTWVMLVVDNPFFWYFGFHSANILNDIEGPFYTVGSPSRQVEDGKAVLAPVDFMNKWDPFLFVFDVKDSKGDPVPNAAFDCWQADTNGGYYFASYTLRGKATTDAEGHVEILTVRPGGYGTRAAHLHLSVNGVKGRHVPMTTQAYVCPGNNPDHLETDIANYWRRRPDQNMVKGWSVPAASGEIEPYCKFPALPQDDMSSLANSIKYWSGKLKERGVDREIEGIGCLGITLTAR
ncbi:Intradiol ring-cleavage dioxygenase [Fomes fomentarius]|nr:Intradiol ring-cleavage dioxygenase [Fomes fomentarius]